MSYLFSKTVSERQRVDCKSELTIRNEERLLQRRCEEEDGIHESSQSHLDRKSTPVVRDKVLELGESRTERDWLLAEFDAA